MAKSGGQIGSMAGMIVGGVIGAIFAIPTGGLSVYAGLSLGATIGGLVGGIAGSLYDTATQDDQVRDQKGVADLSIQTSTYGQTIPQIFGSYGGIAGNVIWCGPKMPVEHRTEERAKGSKGGGPKVVTITRTYTQSIAIGICDTRITGPVSYLRTIYKDLTMEYFGAPGKPLPAGWTFYSGAADQQPDPTIEAQKGVGNVPAFRHLCYVVIKDNDLGMSGRTFNYTFDVATDATTSVAYGAFAVQQDNGMPWSNVESINLITRTDPNSQATISQTQLNGPPVTGGFSGTYSGQVTVGGERAWASNGHWMFELALDGGVISSHHFPEHVAGQYVTFKDYPAGPIIERAGSAFVQSGCAESYSTFHPFNPHYEMYLNRYDPGGGVTFRKFENRRWMWLVGDPHGNNVWMMAMELYVFKAFIGMTGLPPRDAEPVWLYHLDYNLGTISENVVGHFAMVGFHVDPQNRPWIPALEEQRVRRCSSNGNVEAEQVVEGFPSYITTSSDGNIWVLASGHPMRAPTEQAHLFRLDPNTLEITRHIRVDNTSVFYEGGGLLGFENGESQLCPGLNGSVWCLGRHTNSVSHVTADGVVQSFRTNQIPLMILPATAPGQAGWAWVSSLEGGLQLFSPTGAMNPPSSSSPRGGLAGVVQTLCGAAGLSGNQIDVSGMPTGTVQMALVAMQAVRAPLQELAQAFRFYAVESGGRLAFRSIGSGPIVAEIPENDIDAAENAASGDGLQIQRLDDRQLPNTLDVTFNDPALRYQSNTQRHFLNVDVDQPEAPRTVSIGMALSPQQAKQLAEELLTTNWIQREQFTTQTSRKYAYLEPGDRVTITARGLTYPVVLTQTGYGRPGIVELSGVQDAAFVREALGTPTAQISLLHAPGPAEQEEQSKRIAASMSATPSGADRSPHVAPSPFAAEPRALPFEPEPAIARLFNLPVLTSADITPRMHVAFGRTGIDWNGAVLFRSRDGETYEPILDASLEAWFGIARMDPVGTDWHTLDLTSRIGVVMHRPYMQLRSCSDTALYNGANRILLGRELLAFGRADLIGVQTYYLTRLLRGRGGTEHLTGSHTGEETLLFLDSGIYTLPLTHSELWSPRLYKCVGVGQTIDEVEPFSFTATGANCYPWAVANPTFFEEPDGAWLIEWSMRSRFSSDWVQNPEGLSVDFDFRHFRITIFTDETFTTPIRTINTDGGTPLEVNARKRYIYTRSQQAADFGVEQDTIYLRIAQVTDTGSGPAFNYIANMAAMARA